jgi:hypothetical protein
MGMGTGLSIPSSTRNSHGNAPPTFSGLGNMGFNPNCFEMEGEGAATLGLGEGSVFCYDTNDDVVKTEAAGSSGGKKERRKRKHQELTTAADSCTAPTTLVHENDASVQAAVLITYQIASKSASIDELMQLFAPTSQTPMPASVSASGAATGGGGVALSSSSGVATGVAMSGDADTAETAGGGGTRNGSFGRTTITTSLSSEVLYALDTLPPRHHQQHQQQHQQQQGHTPEQDYIVLGLSGSVNTSPTSLRSSPTAAGRVLVQSSYKKKSPKAIAT